MPFKTQEQKVDYRKVYYQKNKEKLAEYQRQKRREVAKWFADFKSDKACVTCGESHPACLDFHHKEGNDKDMDVGYMVRQKLSMERIMSEIAKCDIVCANCHRKLHYDGKL